MNLINFVSNKKTVCKPLLSSTGSSADYGNALSIVPLSRIIALSVLSFAFSGSLMAVEFQSLQSIRMQAEDYIQQYPYESPYSPRFEVSNIDKRLRLKACLEPLLVEFSRRDKPHGNTALNVSCSQAGGWKLLLPVRIELFDDVLVLTQAVHKGQIIDNSLVKHQKKNISRLNNGYYSQQIELEGLEARRNIRRGTILTPASLSPRLMVKSGQQVTLILDYKGLQIKSSGQALQSARRGDVVKVRNNQSRKIVEGVVSGEAQVRIHI